MVSDCSSAFDAIKKLAWPGSELLIETKVDLTHIDPRMGGHLDYAFVETFGRLHVIDFKYGAGVVVEPEENTQLICYAIGVARMYDYNFTEVVIAIYQPRAEHEAGPYREWVTDIETLLAWEKKFKEAAARTLQPDAPLKYNEKWCRFCPAKSICPEISTQALKDAQLAFTDAEGLDDIRYPVPNKVGLGKFDLGKIMEALPKLETWIKAVREHAFAYAQAGNELPGWKLVEKRSTRKWLDPEKTAARARFQFGSVAFTEPELLSPAQLEKVVGKKYDKWIANRVTAISSGMTLVPETDSRSSVQLADAFFEITPEEIRDIKPSKPTKRR